MTHLTHLNSRSLATAQDIFENQQVMLGIPMIRQQEAYWCWAACAHMVLVAEDNNLAPQCTIAGWLFQEVECCANNERTCCDQAVTAHQVVQIFEHRDIPTCYMPGTISCQSLRARLAAGIVVEMGLINNAGTGHLVLVVGYRWKSSGWEYFVNDPGRGNLRGTYDALLNNWGNGRWVVTWLVALRTSLSE